MSRPLADEHIHDISPYVPGKQVAEVKRELGLQDVIKMASNENPLGPSPLGQEAARKILNNEAHVYPDGAAHALKEAISAHHDVPREEILTGNGSDELLRLAVQTLARAGEDHGIVSKYSFGAYPIALKSHDLEVTAVPMKPGFEYDIDGMLDAVQPNTRALFLANPNNPTGTYVSKDELARLLRELPETVIPIIDEAYSQYVEADDVESALRMRDLHDNLIVTRTFSKCYGLAGLRAGYAIARPEIVDLVNRVREPFNCNRLAQAAAAAALDDDEFVERSVELNQNGREQLEAGLAEMEHLGIDWIPSQTNFLLVETPEPGREIYEAMLRQGVIVRPVDGYGLDHHLRITIGTEEQNERCLEALELAVESVSG